MKTTIINGLKKNKKNVLLFGVGFISLFYYYLSTLVTSYFYYLLLLIISFCVFFVVNFIFKKGQKKKIISYFKITLYTYFIILSLLFVIGEKNEIVEYQVPLNGYTYSKVDKILFTFEGVNFGRYYTLTKYSDVDDLTKEYEVVLKLKKTIKHIYIIKSIGLKKRPQL